MMKMRMLSLSVSCVKGAARCGKSNIIQKILIFLFFLFIIVFHPGSNLHHHVTVTVYWA